MINNLIQLKDAMDKKMTFVIVKLKCYTNVVTVVANKI